MPEVITLPTGHACLVDTADFAVLKRFRWKLSRDNYVIRKSRVTGYTSIHRQILGLLRAPPTLYVDHRDGNKLNNQRYNLRLATNSLNQANRHVIQGQYSKFRGVTWNKAVGKWQAQIKVNQKSIYLGVFADEIEAGLAYAEAAKKHFGEFANTKALELIQKAFDQKVGTA